MVSSECLVSHLLLSARATESGVLFLCDTCANLVDVGGAFVQTCTQASKMSILFTPLVFCLPATRALTPDSAQAFVKTYYCLFLGLVFLFRRSELHNRPDFCYFFCYIQRPRYTARPAACGSVIPGRRVNALITLRHQPFSGPPLWAASLSPKWAHTGRGELRGGDHRVRPGRDVARGCRAAGRHAREGGRGVSNEEEDGGSHSCLFAGRHARDTAGIE